MKNLILICTLIMSIPLVKAAPRFKFVCYSEDKLFSIIGEGYLTGHPMGGLTNLEGFLHITGPVSESLSEATLSVRFAPHYSNLSIYGEIDSIHPTEVEVRANSNIVSRAQDLTAVFKYRSGPVGLSPAGPWKEVMLICIDLIPMARFRLRRPWPHVSNISISVLPKPNKAYSCLGTNRF